MESTEEIVVGEMDVGVGGAELVDTPEQTKKKASRPVKMEAEQETTTLKTGSKFEPMVDTYDSDSSEEGQATTTNQANVSIPPTELPFPVAPLPVGIGASSLNGERPAMYSFQQQQESEKKKNEPLLMEIQKDAPLVSPFVDWTDAKLRQDERDSWFIFQFPTRLPELKSTAVPDAIPSDVPSSSLKPDTVQSMPATVATPSTVTSSFDNALSRASPGRLGKIVVYKSGKTELVMGGDNGTPEVCGFKFAIMCCYCSSCDVRLTVSPVQIRMNVTEGLPCGFVQQAVAIDTEESTYIPLGNVKKTVVVTPNVEDALSSSASS
jgi:hypothetical protein